MFLLSPPKNKTIRTTRNRTKNPAWREKATPAEKQDAPRHRSKRTALKAAESPNARDNLFRSFQISNLARSVLLPPRHLVVADTERNLLLKLFGGKPMNKRKKKNGSTIGIVFEELEPRFLLSADLPGIDYDPVVSEDYVQEAVVIDLGTSPTASTVNSPQSAVGAQQSEGHELVFVDTRTPDYEQLLDDLASQADDGRQLGIITLDADRDGIEQISE